MVADTPPSIPPPLLRFDTYENERRGKKRKGWTMEVDRSWLGEGKDGDDGCLEVGK